MVGVLQFVGLFGCTKETYYDAAYMEVIDIDWTTFMILMSEIWIFILISNTILNIKRDIPVLLKLL